MKVKLYTPIVQGKNGMCFSVNGATNQDRDEAIRLTLKHSEFSNPEAKIIRVDSVEVWEDELKRTY